MKGSSIGTTLSLLSSEQLESAIELIKHKIVTPRIKQSDLSTELRATYNLILQDAENLIFWVRGKKSSSYLAFHLKTKEGYTVEAIAESLNITYITVLCYIEKMTVVDGIIEDILTSKPKPELSIKECVAANKDLEFREQALTTFARITNEIVDRNIGKLKNQIEEVTDLYAKYTNDLAINTMHFSNFYIVHNIDNKYLIQDIKEYFGCDIAYEDPNDGHTIDSIIDGIKELLEDDEREILERCIDSDHIDDDDDDDIELTEAQIWERIEYESKQDIIDRFK